MMMNLFKSAGITSLEKEILSPMSTIVEGGFSNPVAVSFCIFVPFKFRR
jgi:hypothetical protein